MVCACIRVQIKYEMVDRGAEFSQLGYDVCTNIRHGATFSQTLTPIAECCADDITGLVSICIGLRVSAYACVCVFGVLRCVWINAIVSARRKDRYETHSNFILHGLNVIAGC